VNLYLLEREDEVDWDEPAGYVIAAASEEEAREWIAKPGWIEQSAVSEWRWSARVIGTAAPGVEPGEILCDFKAG
jgi:hypothetical protein